jgi:hypothetical protein
MEWFYETGGKQAGPITQSELDALLASGTITGQTLVWRAGQSEWLPYSTIAPAASIAEPPSIPEGPVASCVECGGTFARGEMMSFEGAHVCARCKPTFLQKLKEGVQLGSAGVWRSRKQLVVALDAALPERCVKCNVATTGPRLKRALYWHHPAVYLVILLNLLIYAIVAMSVRKRVTLFIGLCPEHRRTRKMAILTAWLLVLLGVGGFVAGISYEQGLGIIGGIVLFIGGAIYGTMRGRVIAARKIDKQHAWIGGVCQEYLAELPEWKLI